MQHTVVFKLKHALGSQLERVFLVAVKKLAEIPGVKNFQILRQVSPKNIYNFGLSMEFSTAEEYQAYNDHPAHLHFVQTHWMKEVSDFMEIDYSVME